MRKKLTSPRKILTATLAAVVAAVAGASPTTAARISNPFQARSACTERGNNGIVYAGNYWTGTVHGFDAKTGKTVFTLPDFAAQTGTGTDRYGNIYVASYGANAIFEFSPKGKQLAMIAGPNTLLGYPWEVTLDSAGNIYAMSTGAASGGAASVEVFAPGSNGNVAPIKYIAGPNTGLDSAFGIALGPDGNIFTANYVGGQIAEFPLNAGTPSNVNVAPMAIVGTVGAAQQLVVNANYDVYVNGGVVYKIPWQGTTWGIRSYGASRSTPAAESRSVRTGTCSRPTMSLTTAGSPSET